MNGPTGEETIFAEALRLPPEERAAYLAQATHGDAQLRRRVEALLGSYQAGDFLEKAAAPQLRQTLSIPLTEKPGDRIGRYKLLQQIGEGGCGVVYVAEQTEPVRRRVALKIIKLGMDTKSVIARFEAERQALAMMDHPNIAKVFDAGVTDGRARHSVRAGVEPLDGGAQGTDAPYLSPGRPYFVMELVRGKKITDYCDEKKLSPNERLDLFIQVCQAIQHAHQKGIIHRDIKPSNILVTVNDPDKIGMPKVIDFGVAKATGGQVLTDKTVYTAFEQFIGTPAYMSPEQAVLTSLDIDTRSDIYALGVLLYEMLTGRTPFDAKDLLAIGLDEMRRTIRETEPSKPSTRLSTLSGEELSTTAHRRGLEAPKLVSELRGDLDWIVMKALEKDRARRYETANGLAMDVQRHLNNEPVVACPPSRVYRFQKMVQRNKLAFAGGSAVVASLVIGLTLSTLLFFRERAARKVADVNMQVTKAVNQFFLGDILDQARGDAQAERGFTPEPNLTVRQALERAAEKIGHRFKDQPREKVSIQMDIGDGLRAVGQTEEGIAHLQRAVELGRAKLGPEDPLTLMAQGALAYAYNWAGKPDQAVPLYEQTLKLMKARLGPTNGETLLVMHNLAVAYGDAGKLHQALPLGEEIVKVYKARLGPTNRETLGAMSNLGSLYHEAGKLAQARPLLEQTLKLMKATLPRGDTYTEITMNNLANCYRDANKLDLALPLYKETLQLRKGTLGPDNRGTLDTMENLADCYQKVGKLDLALPLYEKTLKLMKAKLRPDDRDTLYTMNNLALCYLDADKPGKALPLAEEVVKLRKASVGPTNRETLGAMCNLALAYSDAGKLNQALPLYEKTLKLMQANLKPGDPFTRNTMGDLADCYRQAGKLDQAVPFAEEAVKMWKASMGPTNRETLGAMCNLALAYSDAGKLDLAQPLYEKTLKLMKANLKPGDPYIQTTVKDLAACYRRAGKLVKLQKLSRDRLTEVRQRAPNDPSKLASPVNDLVWALLSEHKYAEAEQVYNDVLTAPILNQPGSAALVRSRGNLRARRSEWKAAAADYRRAIALRPGDDWVWHSLATVLVQEGDLAAYREHCRQSLERFATTTNPPTADRISQDCLILPSSGVNLETVGKMEDLGITTVTNYSFGYWFELDKGLGQYRLGHFSAALDWVRRGMAAKTNNWKGQVFGQAVRAMAQYRLKQTRQAGVTLSNALELADTKLPKLESGGLTSGWLNVVLSRALLREAKGLIGGTSATNAPAQ